MPLIVTTYNVLADAYVKPEYYPLCKPADFVRQTRYPRIADRLLGIGGDVICLQEVDYLLFRHLEKRLTGYRGRWAHKGNGKPDGCATFIRKGVTCLETRILEYDDSRTPKKGPSGHVALITQVERDGLRIVVANTHLKWDAPSVPPRQQWGLAQTEELLRMPRLKQPHSIIVGDFNAESDSARLKAFRAYGFSDAYPASVLTCNPSGKARKIDYLLHSEGLTAEPRPTTWVKDKTPLPSETEPSDHVPLTAVFEAL